MDVNEHDPSRYRTTSTSSAVSERYGCSLVNEPHHSKRYLMIFVIVGPKQAASQAFEIDHRIAEVPKLPDLPDIDTLGPALLLVLPVQMSERALESLKHILGHFSGSVGPAVKSVCQTFFGPAGFIPDQLKSDTAGPNVRHSSQSFRNLCSRYTDSGHRVLL